MKVLDYVHGIVPESVIRCLKGAGHIIAEEKEESELWPWKSAKVRLGWEGESSRREVISNWLGARLRLRLVDGVQRLDCLCRWGLPVQL